MAGRRKTDRPHQRWTIDRARCLAPLERQPEVIIGEGCDEEDSAEQIGSLRVDTGDLAMPEGIVDEDDGTPWWMPGKAAVVITVLALVFVAWIAWIVSTRTEWKEGEGWKIRLERQ